MLAVFFVTEIMNKACVLHNISVSLCFGSRFCSILLFGLIMKWCVCIVFYAMLAFWVLMCVVHLT